MGQTGRHTGGRAPRQKFPPEIQRIIRHRRRWAWTAIAALLLMSVFGSSGPGYSIPDDGAHAALVAAIIALWAVALGLVRVGTVRLLRRGVYTVGVIDAPFRPIRRWATRPSVRSERSSRFVAGFGTLIIWASSLRDQAQAVAYLAHPAGQTLAASNQEVPFLLAGMILDAVAVAIALHLVLSVGRRPPGREPPWYIRAAWVGRRPDRGGAAGGDRAAGDRSTSWI